MSLEELRNSRILVVHQGAVGDLILALPAIKALRASLHPSSLEIMGHPWTMPLAKGYPHADAIIDVNRGDMAPLFQDGAPLPTRLSKYFSRFDGAFCFSQSTVLAHNLLRAGIKKTFTLPSFPSARLHMIDHHLSSLSALGIFAPPTSAEILLHDDERARAREFFIRQGWSRNTIIALHPGAGGKRKIWPAARFAAVGRFFSRQGKRILILQGPADEDAVQGILTDFTGVPHLVVNDAQIARLAALLSCVSLYIGNDSGITHLAAALKVPTMAIFGPTDPLVWAPRGEKTIYVQGKVACAPCRVDKQRRCERQQCLDDVHVEDVLTIALDWMNLPPRNVFCHKMSAGIKRFDDTSSVGDGISATPP